MSSPFDTPPFREAAHSLAATPRVRQIYFAMIQIYTKRLESDRIIPL